LHASSGGFRQEEGQVCKSELNGGEKKRRLDAVKNSPTHSRSLYLKKKKGGGVHKKKWGHP